MKCPTCGAEAAPGVRFCETCGTPLQQTTSTANDAPAAHAQPTYAQPTYAQPTGRGQTAHAQNGGDVEHAQQTNAPHSRQYYEAAPPYELSVSGSAAGWQGGYQAAPTPQAAPPKQGSTAPFVLAIIALVTAVLGVFPVSLVLAIVALVMNRRQEKRGEQSTKRTPTLVMALIGLILSILVALATFFLGGIIWLALMEDGIDLEHITASTVPAQETAAAEPSGVWELVSMTDGDDVFDEEYLELMEEMGVSFGLVLAKDGTAALEFFDENATGTWEAAGLREVAITFDSDTLVGTIVEDELTLSYKGGSMVLRRTQEEAPASVSGFNTIEDAAEPSQSTSSTPTPADSPSGSSADSAGSTSSSAATQSTDPNDAVGEPTLGNFSWYAGAGGIPDGADILTSIYDVEGTWKAYIFGNGMDRLCTMTIEAGQTNCSATIDWLYVHDNSTDETSEDTTSDSVFEGDWDGPLGLEALGPGRIALTDFWQNDDRQYGMGSFMWPSGETDMVLLVRP